MECCRGGVCDEAVEVCTIDEKERPKRGEKKRSKRESTCLNRVGWAFSRPIRPCGCRGGYLLDAGVCCVYLVGAGLFIIISFVRSA